MKGRPMVKLKITHSELVNQYVGDVQAVSKIAKAEGVARSTVRNRLKKLGVKLRARSAAHRGIRPPNYKGGWIDEKGYRCQLVNGKKVYSHRIITRAMPGQVVHHKNHNRADNSPDNLLIFSSQGEHVKHHRMASRRGTLDLKKAA